MQITHCPECATAFKVTPEHLQLAGGWVRCGRCGAVFEALQHLQSREAAAVETALSETTPKPADASPPLPSIPPSSPIPEEGPPSESSLDAVWNEKPLLHDVRPGEETAIHDPIHATDHVPIPWPSIACGALLVLALLWQVILYKRDWLMAQEPGLQSTLSVLCAPFGCQPQWPSLPDSLQIESSTFTHDAQGSYSVQMRVKNVEHFPLAAPHLELTLLDATDTVVLRRVLTPKEMSLASPIPALRDVRAGFEFMLDAALMERVTGYRVLLFYP